MRVKEKIGIHLKTNPEFHSLPLLLHLTAAAVLKVSVCLWKLLPSSGDAVPFFSLMELSKELASFLTRSSTCFPRPRDKCSGIYDSEWRTGPTVWKIGLFSKLWSLFALDFTEPPFMNFSLSEQIDWKVRCEKCVDVTGCVRFALFKIFDCGMAKVAEVSTVRSCQTQEPGNKFPVPSKTQLAVGNTALHFRWHPITEIL